MSFFIDHPRARWILPVAAVGVIGATALTVNQSANADSGLPPRTASQLLADVRAADVSSLSGTVVQTSDLGLPEIPGLGGSVGGGSSSSSLTSLISGTHTWRVWLDGPTRQRLALIGSNGESDVIRNGSDVWLWSSADKSAVHHTLTSDQVRAGGAGHLPGGLPGGIPSSTPSGMPGGTATGTPGPLPSGAPRTPDEAAAAALALMGQDTAITTSGAASVAGRSAYELVLTPKDKTTLVGSVRIAIDSEVHVPLRVQVYSTKRTNPAFEVGFTAVDFAKPDARQFAFTPPAGTKVTESDKLGALGGGASARPAAPTSPAKPSLPATGQGAPKIVGTGWSTVVVAPFSLPAAPKASNGSSGSSGSASDSAAQLNGILKALPTTSGSWGSGHVLEGTLFSVVLTTDGRVAVGAVPPAQLYSALAAK
jgi:outer membrane lipoprotein-sorting protein